MRLLIDNFKIELIGSGIMPSAKFNTLARAALHFSKPQSIADQQVLLIGAKAQQAAAHVVAHTTRAWLAQSHDQAHAREVSPHLFSAHNYTAHIADNAA